jgi:hypothetical protein
MLCFFFVVKFCKIAKTKKGPMKGLYNVKVVIFFPLDLNHCAKQKDTLMMDGLNPLSSKSDGHNSLVATLLAKCKAHHHLTQASNVFRHLHCGRLKFHRH